MLFKAEQLREAETEFRKALASRSTLRGTATTEAAAVQLKIAETLYAQNREAAESLSLVDQVIRTFKKNDVSDGSLDRAMRLRALLLDRVQ